MRYDDFAIAIAYLSIPVQILFCVYRYPRLASMPVGTMALVVLFILFILLCGLGHSLRCMDMMDTQAFGVVNTLTAVVSMTTAASFMVLVPDFVGALDHGLKGVDMLDHVTKTKQRKLLVFMAFLCHEIRNPLFAITSAMTFLGDDPLTENQQSALSSILEAANLMLRIVNDVLDISKIESGKLELEKHDFNLRQLLEGVATSTRAQIKQAPAELPIKFNFSIEKEVPTIVSGDSARLLQIAYNLLSNASKFTEKGYVDFSVSVVDYDEAVKNKLIDVGDEESEDDSSDAEDFTMDLLRPEEDCKRPRINYVDSTILRVVVSDTGCGIAAERLHSIFEPFSQSKLSDYRTHGGTGLGLSILSRITKSMGGTIHVESVEGLGSKFSVHVPITIVADPLDILLNNEKFGSPVDSVDAMPFLGSPSLGISHLCLTPELELPRRAATGDQPSSCDREEVAVTKSFSRTAVPKFDFPPTSAVVLVVDDNMTNCKLLGRMLSKFNLEYDTVFNGKEAVDKILESRNVTGDQDAPFYSLILMDMSMPVMGGAEATRILRGEKVTIPIVALTANALVENKEEALKAGATEFVTKPIMRNDLHTLCGRYLLPV